MSTPCCCFRNKGALQSGSAPAGIAGFDVGGGTQHRLFHRGNQGPLLEKAKQIFPNKNRSREMHSFHHGVFYMCCDVFLLPSTHDPPFNLCHFQQSSSPTEHHGSAAPAHCTGSPQPCRTGSPLAGFAPPPQPVHGSRQRGNAGARDIGVLSLPAETRDTPFLGRLFASDTSAPRRGIYRAMFSPPLLKCVWKFSTSAAIRFVG